MVLTWSVIVPARNSARTLDACLKSIFSQNPPPAEVLIVNDGSTDETGRIAASWPCRVLDVNIGRGPMRPRFEGARAASGEILVFIDSDVRLLPGTAARLLEHFRDDSVSAVTGILSRTGGPENFFSAYKNEYMNYIFSRQPECSQFLYGSFWAVRRRAMIYFEPVTDPFGDLVSDSEMGFRLRREGREILLDRELQVEHLKSYGFFSLLQNDFRIPFMFARIFSVYRSATPWVSGGRFSHASWKQTAATGLAFLALAALPWTGSGAALFIAACLGLFYAYWSRFLAGLLSRGFLFFAGAVLFTWLDAAVMFVGMVCGFAYTLLRSGVSGPGVPAEIPQ